MQFSVFIEGIGSLAGLGCVLTAAYVRKRQLAWGLVRVK